MFCPANTFAVHRVFPRANFLYKIFQLKKAVTNFLKSITCLQDRPPPSSYSGKTGPSLSEPLPDLAKALWAATSEHSFSATQISTLDSGIRVVTEPKYGTSSTLGVIVDAGSRYQIAYPPGVVHLLEKLAFTVSMFLLS